jgi:hypothetical protein
MAEFEKLQLTALLGVDYDVLAAGSVVTADVKEDND